MPKRSFLKTFALFLLAVLAVLLPFGVVISYKISVKCGFISENSSLRGIIGSFSGIFSEKRSDNTDLRANLVVIHCIKPLQFPQLPEQLQQLTPQLPPQLCLIYLLLTACILLNNLVQNMQYNNHIKYL